MELLNRNPLYKRQIGVWPKTPVPLTPEQKIAREKFMMLWHQLLPNKYSAIEKFNHGYVARLPLSAGIRTLEIGAGLGEHAKYEDLRKQDYCFLEYREEFCVELRKKFPKERVFCGDIHVKQAWPDRAFDRIVAIHVLEHLPNLPVALNEIHRLLKDDGILDIVIPCEGGLAHTLGREISAARIFRKNFHMDFTPIARNEHVNTCHEILGLLKASFQVKNQSYFPLKVPIPSLNFCLGMRLAKQ